MKPAPFLAAPRRAALALAAALALPAAAAINYGATPELFLTIWDPESKASYTLDLGLDANSFMTQAQVDTGWQVFLPRITTAGDPAFRKFIDLVAPSGQQQDLAATAFGSGTLKSRLRWAILGVDDDGFEPVGDLRIFHTLEQGPGGGVLNPSYGRLHQMGNETLQVTIGALSTQLVQPLDVDAANPDNTHRGDPPDPGNHAHHGSSLTVQGQAGYFDTAGTEFYRLSTSALTPITNEVGKSSWFYMTTTSSAEGTETVLVDEFDNLTHDGYWGLDQDPADGAFVLSYTLGGSGSAAALAQREFAFAIGRTERGGGFGVRALGPVLARGLESGAGTGIRALGAAAVSPVPEPSTAATTLGGLALLAAWALHRRRRP